MPERLNPDHWRRLGMDEGRRNVPLQAAGVSPARSALDAAWRAELRGARTAYVERVSQLDARRLTGRRVLAETRSQAVSDVRQATAVPMLLEQAGALDNERRALRKHLADAVDRLTQRAHECDAAWRSANESNRDRRTSLPPAAFVVPDEILLDIPDPL